MVVTVINVDSYPLLASSELICYLRIQDRCFVVSMCPLIVRRPNLEVATKRLLRHQIKTLK